MAVGASPASLSAAKTASVSKPSALKNWDRAKFYQVVAIIALCFVALLMPVVFYASYSAQQIRLPSTISSDSSANSVTLSNTLVVSSTTATSDPAVQVLGQTATTDVRVASTSPDATHTATSQRLTFGSYFGGNFTELASIEHVQTSASSARSSDGRAAGSAGCAASLLRAKPSVGASRQTESHPHLPRSKLIMYTSQLDVQGTVVANATRAANMVVTNHTSTGTLSITSQLAAANVSASSAALDSGALAFVRGGWCWTFSPNRLCSHCRPPRGRRRHRHAPDAR